MLRHQVLTLLLLIVGAGAARHYDNREYQFSAISSKLDTFISNLGSVGSELKTLNAAYKALKQGESAQYGSNDFDGGASVQALLGADSGSASQTWDQNSSKCVWAEHDFSREMHQDQMVKVRKVFCSDVNHFLTAIEYSDESGMLVGKCCERIKKKKQRG